MLKAGLRFLMQMECSPVIRFWLVSLGTARSDGLLHRLHVGLRLAAVSVTGFRRDLQAMLTNHKGTAALRRWREAQPNQRLYSTASVSISERSKERARRG